MFVYLILCFFTKKKRRVAVVSRHRSRRGRTGGDGRALSDGRVFNWIQAREEVHTRTGHKEKTIQKGFQLRRHRLVR